MNRRDALRLSVLASTTLLPANHGLAQAPSLPSATELQALITEWQDDPANEPFFNLNEAPGRGTLILKAEDLRVRQAAAILAAVPKLRPIEIAKYFIDKVPDSDKMEWPRDTPMAKRPANPMIVAFFAATQHAPIAGDQTAWCAAFMCWVLQRAGLNQPRHAGSRAFRGYQTETNDPQPGDIAVYYNTKDTTFGHVAFFDGFADPNKTRIFLVGGNQSNTINRQTWGLISGDLKIHSFRTSSGLRA